MRIPIMKFAALILSAASLAALCCARSVRLPEARFASLDGLASDDGDTVEAFRAPRHASLGFAEFDQPLSAADPEPHHRVPRDAGAAACDCADNPELLGEFVDTAPVLEEQYCPEVVAQPQRPDVLYELVEAPEERAGVVLTADDAHLDDDQEATLCQEGLHPVDIALDDLQPCAGRPARHTETKAATEVQASFADETGAAAATSDGKEEISAGGSLEVEGSIVGSVKGEASKNGGKVKSSEELSAEVEGSIAGSVKGGSTKDGKEIESSKELSAEVEGSIAGSVKEEASKDGGKVQSSEELSAEVEGSIAGSVKEEASKDGGKVKSSEELSAEVEGSIAGSVKGETTKDGKKIESSKELSAEVEGSIAGSVKEESTKDGKERESSKELSAEVGGSIAGSVKEEASKDGGKVKSSEELSAEVEGSIAGSVKEEASKEAEAGAKADSEIAVGGEIQLAGSVVRSEEEAAS